MDFEWDERKRKSNLEKHKIDFVDAAYVFLDQQAICWVDARKDYKEVRFRIIGSVFGCILHVVYTERKNRMRLISARRANTHEKHTYLQH